MCDQLHVTAVRAPAIPGGLKPRRGCHVHLSGYCSVMRIDQPTRVSERYGPIVFSDNQLKQIDYYFQTGIYVEAFIATEGNEFLSGDQLYENATSRRLSVLPSQCNLKQRWCQV
jgi:hypothetical protein